jgi:hypothetical protein
VEVVGAEVEIQEMDREDAGLPNEPLWLSESRPDKCSQDYEPSVSRVRRPTVVQLMGLTIAADYLTD